jgi:hypothetical protein
VSGGAPNPDRWDGLREQITRLGPHLGGQADGWRVPFVFSDVKALLADRDAAVARADRAETLIAEWRSIGHTGPSDRRTQMHYAFTRCADQLAAALAGVGDQETPK